MTALVRSLMFVPGHRQRMVEKALALAELDVALLDLEDGVPPGEKDAARRLVAAAVVRPAGGPLRVEQVRGAGEGLRPAAPLLFVRVNRVGSEHLRDDLAAVVRPGLAALLVPKVDAADDVLAVDRILLELEPAAGLARESVRLLPSIETAKGLLAAPAIAACSARVMGLLFGAEDFALDLGVATAREGEARELLYARSAVVVAAAAAGIPAFDGIWPDIRDLDGLRRDALQARRDRKSVV